MTVGFADGLCQGTQILQTEIGNLIIRYYSNFLE